MDSKVLTTLANSEYEERYDWADEVNVFRFDQEAGTVEPHSKVSVTVTFAPKAKQDYFSTFRFVCPFTAMEEQSKAEATCTVELLGTGRFEEFLDHDYDHHY